MIKRCVILGSLALGCGFFTLNRSGLTGYQRPTEKWLETVTPTKVLGAEFDKSSNNPAQSYPMPKEVYESLKPFGIVSRVFTVDGQRFDSVVIAGDNADSFHDQRACFVSQGWSILSDKVIELDMGSQGKGNAVLLDLQGSNGRTYAIYCFRGPSGTVYSEFGGMWRDYFFKELLTGQVHGGQFYRFIALDGESGLEGLKKFAGAYMEEGMQMFDKGKAERGAK